MSRLAIPKNSGSQFYPSPKFGASADLVVNHLNDNPDEFEKVCRDLKTLQQESRTDWINWKKSLKV